MIQTFTISKNNWTIERERRNLTEEEKKKKEKNWNLKSTTYWIYWN